MQKTIVITGATDGIGLETAKRLAADGHTLLIHGRNTGKLAAVAETLKALPGAGTVETLAANLDDLSGVEALASAVVEGGRKIDVLINNAGVLKAPDTTTRSGVDIRFMVNTIAPYHLTQRVLAVMNPGGRVVNVASAAQDRVNLDALSGPSSLSDMEAYSQSKLAIIQWTYHSGSNPSAQTKGSDAPMFVSVNPGSLLASKMVKEGFGIAGSDLSIGADILVQAALSDAFSGATGKYYDNDAKRFGQPHPDGFDAEKAAATTKAVEEFIAKASR